MIDYIINEIEKLVNIDSPSGFCDKAVAYVTNEIEAMGYEVSAFEKGGVIVNVPGSDQGQTLAMAAHLDTLGAMVRSVNSDGTLRFTSIGGFLMSSVSGAYCRIHTREGKVYTGTILSKEPTVHVYDNVRDYKLIEENMHIRLDELVDSKETVEDLGIEVGNFVGFDPNFQVTDSGYIKSRHLDNKAGASILMALLKHLKDDHIKLPYDLKILFTTYEEVGHGAAYIPEDIKKMLVVDMGAVGHDLSCTEEKVSICVKDSSGPYDRQMVDALLATAKEQGLDYSLDVYPHYGSDGSAALKGGANIRAALIGPGVHASHHTERTHRKGLDNAYRLLVASLDRI